ncbi:hypothetical protein [Streptomyces sp. NPDC060035]
MIVDCTNEELAPVPARRRQEHSEATDEFIDRARAILGGND